MQVADRVNNKLIIPLSLISGILIAFCILKIGGIITLALVISLFFTILVVLYPIIGIIAIIAGTTFISFYENFPFTGIGSIHIPDLCLFLVFSIVSIRPLIFHNVSIIRTPLDIPIIIFVSIAFISLISGTLLHYYEFFVAVREFKVVPYYLLAFIIANTIKDEKQLKILIYASLFMGTIAAFENVINAAINPPMLGDDPADLFYSYHDLTKSGMLTYWTAVSFIAILSVSKLRVHYILGALLSLFSLILSFSRHWWISFIFSVFLNLTLISKRYKAKILGFILVLISSIFLLIFIQMGSFGSVSKYLNLVGLRLESLLSGRNLETIKWRELENEYALKQIVKSPIGGIGFSRPYRPKIYGPDDSIQWFTHHGYLWILLKFGIIGFMPFVWFSYVFVKRSIKYWGLVKDEFIKLSVLIRIISIMTRRPKGIAVLQIVISIGMLALSRIFKSLRRVRNVANIREAISAKKRQQTIPFKSKPSLILASPNDNNRAFLTRVTKTSYSIISNDL